MKKICAVIFLTTTIISTTSCMEKQRSKRQSYEEEAQFPSVSPSVVVPVYLHGIHQVVPNSTPVNNNNNKHQLLPQNMPMCVANEPGWQQLNAIAEMPYQRNQSQLVQSSTTNEF